MFLTHGEAERDFRDALMLTFKDHLPSPALSVTQGRTETPEDLDWCHLDFFQMSSELHNPFVSFQPKLSVSTSTSLCMLIKRLWCVLLFVCMCTRMHVCEYTCATACVWRSEDNLQPSVSCSGTHVLNAVCQGWQKIPLLAKPCHLPLSLVILRHHHAIFHSSRAIAHSHWVDFDFSAHLLTVGWNTVIFIVAIHAV